jgi:2-succinyl-5-enolpyruvyl-6-hydroxy-3-cyclohexene-1-carboxylate synthase
MGYAMMNENPVILITGELSFMYDINGLWNQYIPPYTRIIVVNNGEGNIFRIIPGLAIPMLWTNLSLPNTTKM